MAITRGIKFITFLVLALSFSLFVAEGHRGLATPPTCTCQNNNNNNNNEVTKNNNNNTSTTTTTTNNNTTTTTNKNSNTTTTTKNNNNNNNNNNKNNTNKNNTTTTNNNNKNNTTTTNKNKNNNNNAVYDVTTFGAQGNGKAVYKNGDSMNGIAFMQAWQKACYMSMGSSKVVIPKGTFAVAEVVFAGPCKTSNITIELQGNLIADPDVSQFPNHEFIVFQNVDGVTFTGQGTLDVSNQVNKSCNPSKNDADVFNQLSSIKLFKANNVVVEGLTSVNPASQHVLVVESQKVTIRNVKFNEKPVASNTKSNGIYISASSQVSVSNSFISTGDDCVTIAPGSTSISITGLTCAGGKGISIGSLAFTKNVLDVKGVLVKNCVFKGTVFGVSINPRLEAKLSLISDINVENLVMDGVQSPIVIKQQDSHIKLAESIQAKIMNVHIKNINGTATTRNALSFSCSLESPCEGIKVDDVDLSFNGNALQAKDDLSIIGKTMDNLKGLDFLVNCLNAKVVFGGRHKGLSCNLLQ